MRKIKLKLPSFSNRRINLKTLIFGKNFKRIKVLTLVILLFNIIAVPLASLNPVHADSFYPSAEGDNCNLITVYGMQYDSLGGGGVNWNSGDVRGVSGNWIQNHRFMDVATPWYPDAHRYSGVADFVAVPPNTRVELGAFMYNYAGHNIHVNRLDLWTSSDVAGGDWTRLGAGGSNTTRSIKVGGVWRSRTDKLVSANWNSTYADGPNYGGQQLYSFNVIQPIQLVSFNATPEWSGQNLRVRYDLRLRNVSSYNLSNINVTDHLPDGSTYNQNHYFSAGQSRTITYYADMGTDYPHTITNDPATIRDPNSHTEIVARRKTNLFDKSLQAQPGVISRNDSPAPGWYAHQPVWGEEGSDWGIRLIPYWFESGSVTVDLNSNISIHKTVSDNDETNVQTNTAENNEQITYTINVSNSEARAEDIRVVDDYNENFFTILDADGGNDDGDTITWNISELAHGENRTFTIQAQIIDLDQGDYTFRNNAWTENPSEGPVWAETIVNPRANISIDKVVSDSDEDSVKVNAVQGDHYDSDERLVRFDITYANDGDADAHNVILTDDLSQFQSEGVIVSVDNISNGGVYDSSTGLITWNIGDLPDGESGSQSFALQLERIGNGNRGIVNTTTIDTEQTSPINSTTTTNILTPEYTIEKTDNTDTATTGDTLNYQLTLSNTGTGDGYNIVVEDILPDYIEAVDNVSNGGDYDSSTDTIIWEETTDSGISLNSGESRVFSFDVKIPDIMPVGSTILTNRATIDSPTEEVKEDTDDTTVEAQPELDIEKYVRNLTAISEGRGNSGENIDSEYGADADSWYNNNNDVITIAGDEIQYTLVYRNTGNANSPDTFIADHLPRYILDEDGNQYEIIREGDFVNIDDNVTPIENGNGWDIVWDIGTLEVDSEWVVTQFTVRINASSTVTLSQEATDRLIDNTSEIYSDNDQVLPDTDNAVIRVDQPNAEIVKESDKVIYQSNEEVIYEITVSNNGSSTATGIVRDILPTDMHYISSNPDVTHQDGQLLEWEVTLGVGESTTIVITAGFDIPVEDQQFFDNQVLYDYTDINSNERPDVEDNAEVQVLAPVIEVEKEKIEADVVTPLNTIKYIVKMRNVGSGTAYGINIKDTIDVELVEVLEDTISHGGTWDAENQVITWDMGELEAGEEIERSFTAKVKFGEEINDGDQIENSVTIENDTTATIESNVVTSEINCGYLAGTIWEDENKNAIIDEGELRIPNAEIDVTVEDFEKYGATFESNDSGQYVATCLPYERDVDVDIIRPTGYIGQTTVDNYRVRLSMSGDTEIYELDEEGNTLLVWAGSSFEHADLGLYRDRLASGSVLGVSTMAMSSTGIPTILALLGTTGLALGLYFGIRDREKMKKRLKKVLSFDTIKNIWN